jgi:hypothetical protein
LAKNAVSSGGLVDLGLLCGVGVRDAAVGEHWRHGGVDGDRRLAFTRDMASRSGSSSALRASALRASVMGVSVMGVSSAMVSFSSVGLGDGAGLLALAMAAESSLNAFKATVSSSSSSSLRGRGLFGDGVLRSDRSLALLWVFRRLSVSTCSCHTRRSRALNDARSTRRGNARGRGFLLHAARHHAVDVGDDVDAADLSSELPADLSAYLRGARVPTFAVVNTLISDS